MEIVKQRIKENLSSAVDPARVPKRRLYTGAELPAVEKVVLPCFFGAIAATLIALLAGGPVVSSLLELWMGA